MVFESVVTDLLNKILGDYVENLDKNQLKIGIWGGDVVLKNLKLRENALDDLDLPVQLVYGYLGTLILKIPWKNLYSQPVVANIEDFYILISPKQSVQYDAEKEEKYDLQTKQTALQALDDAHQKELDKDKPKPDASFSEKLTAQIVNNLQVKITNVHLRYEDTTTTGMPFAFGASLDNLEICTTNSDWVKCYLTEQVSRVFKIANLDSLSVYMNCNTELYSNNDFTKLPELFCKNIARQSVVPDNYSYMVGPISSIAKLKLNMNPEYDSPPFQIPKIDLYLEMQKLNIGMTSTQFQSILKLADSMNRMKLGAPYRKYRPFNIPYKNNYKEWWRFAITAVLEEDIRAKNQRWTWQHIKNHRELCNTYAESYKEKCLNKKPPATLIETCTLLEQKLDLFNLVLIRQRVNFDVDKIRKEEESKATNSGWFGGWFGGRKSVQADQSTDIVTKFEAEMTDEEKHKLYKAIGYQENAVPLDLPEDYEAVTMYFKLVALEIGLYDDSKLYASGTKTSTVSKLNELETIMLLHFSTATCSLQQRPAASAICLNAGMKELRLTGLEQKNDPKPPVIIKSKVSDEFNLFDIFFETNPKDKQCDQRIKVLARPLQIVYHSDTILRLIKVFSPQQSVNLSELEGAASARMANFKERSATGMQYMIDKRPIVEIDVTFMPNVIIMPHTGIYVPGESSLIVLSLGQLHIVSQPRQRATHDIGTMFDSGKEQEEILRSVMRSAYDNLKISIEDIQLLVAKPRDNWEQVLALSVISNLHILRPTSIIVALSLCVVDDDPRCPKTKVEILLPNINISIGDTQVLETLQILTSIPTPENETPEPPPLKKSGSLTSSKLSLPSLFSQDTKKTKPKQNSKSDTTLTTEEVVQYTSLELNFALKEFSVTIFKSSCSQDTETTNPISPIDSSQINKDSSNTLVKSFSSQESDSAGVLSPSDSNKFGTPEEVMPCDSAEMLTLESQKIICCRILQLEATMVQRTYELVATAKLGAISLKQYDYFGNTETTLSIIDTPGFSEDTQQYLLIISYTMADKISPEFITKYNSTEQLIEVKFSTLNMTLHQENILYLMQFANELQTKLEAVTAKKAPKDRDGYVVSDGLVTKLTAIIEEEGDENAITPTTVTPQTSQETRKRRQAKVVDSIKISVVANLEQVNVLVTCKKRPLARLAVDQFNAGVILKSSYTEVNLRLKDIQVTDLNPKSIHSSIFSIVGNNAFNCQVVLFNLDETSNYNSDDMKVQVEIGCMKIVFLNWFVTAMLSFLNNFQAAQQAVANASAAAADAAKQNAINAYEKATRMKLNIRIKAPIIVVPVDSQSNDALALDLGFLMLTNTTSEIAVPNNDANKAVIDDIKLELKDMKLSKVATVDVKCAGVDVIEADTVDLAYGIKSNLNILNPTSFTLNVKRNLSNSWYKDVPEIDLSGRLHSIELNVLMEDYALIMSILNRNLAEGVNEFPPVETPPPPPSPATVASAGKLTTKRSTAGSPARNSLQASPVHPLSKQSLTTVQKESPTAGKDAKKIYEALKFNFQFDGVTLVLLQEKNVSLARFGIYFLSLKGTKLVDGTLSTSIVLCNIQLEDTRPNRNSRITKYLCRKDWKCNEDVSRVDCGGYEKYGRQKERNYMLDLTAIIKENDTFAEVRVCGFDLILCIDFLLKLANFFTIPDAPPTQKPKEIETKAIEQKAVQKKCINEQPAEKKMNLILHIEEPDIILVESLEDINTNAIIFNMQAQLNYREHGPKTLINGQIDALKMYMCSFLPEKRESTRHFIIHPCVISLQGSTPEESGLHVSLKLSEIIINVSPATIELLNKAMQTISANTADNMALQKVENDYTNIWQPKPFNERDYWFIKVDQAYDAFELLEEVECVAVPESVKKEETCIVEMPSLTIVVETGVGYYTTPLMSIDTCLNAIANDWSGNLKVKGSLTLNMNYYNQALAVWEPIIEMNERMKPSGEIEYLPWELSFNLNIESKKYDDDDDDEDQVEQKTTTIKIHSAETLELTVSKTCLDLLGVLGEAFSQAIDSALVKPEVIAPYVVENDTGFDISINFRHGIFTLHECHMPNATTTELLNRSLVFKADETNADLVPDLVKDCTISASGRVHLQTKDLSTLTSEEDEEYNLFVKVGSVNKEINLPVSKSDKRYFPLMHDTHEDPWGIISEVRSEYGTTKINIHGVVNIQNHFTTPVRIYRNKPKTFEKILVGEVAPGEVFHLPLHAIYAETKDLYFSLTGYNISVQGVKWNDCPTDLNYMRQLQCDPVDTFEPLYINVRREKTEVYFENTNKFKLYSSYYTLHLRPPLYLCNALPIAIKVSVAGCSVRQNGAHPGQPLTDDQENSLVKEDMLDYGEKEVLPGNVLHLPTVKMSGKSKESRSYLVVRLIQYLEKDWSCTTDVEEHEPINTWKFTSYDSASKMDMNLCVRSDDRHGSLQLTLYSPFWMINKTGLMLSYKTDTETVDVLYHPPEYKGPILFSFREKIFFAKKSATIRVDNGEWSDKIPLDVAGSTGEVTCKANDLSYQIGVHNHLTYNSLTKQITFIPFYIATNKCDFTIELQEQSRPADPWIKIEPNAFVPIWPKNDSDNMVVAKVNDQRTVAFNYSEAQCMLLQLNNNKYGGINVDVQATEGGVYITFTEYNAGDAPGLIINHTTQPISYYENDKKSSVEMVLKPHFSTLYAWANPTGEKCIIFGQNEVKSDLRRDGVGELVLKDGKSAFWVSFLDGLQRVILFTEMESIAKKSECTTTLQCITQSIEVGIHGIGLSLVNNEANIDILYLGITSSGIIWESKKENKKRFKQMNIHDTAQLETQYQQFILDKIVKEEKPYFLDSKYQIDFNKMLLMKSNPRTLKRTFYPGVWISMNTSPYQTQLHAKINNIQLDNQLTDCIFPVVLAPIAPPKSVATTTALKPFVECSIVQRVVPNSTVKQFKYASMLIQEFHFKVDLLFLTALAGMFSSTVSDEQAAKLFNENVESIERPLSDLVTTQSMAEQKNFYDTLHLGPLKIHVSFSMAGSDTSALPGILSTLVQGVGVTLTDVNDVVFRLAFFEREYQFLTQRQLTSEITAHYTGQALKQLYVLVLGLDVLGNPYGLVVGLKKGVEDLFYEPFQGAIQGPGEFAEGLVLGVKSLFGHTVGGAAGAVSKITGAMGKGLAALTFDEEYQRKRRQAMQNKPTNFSKGIARSGKGLVMGFVDGVTGVVTKPVEGAKEQGVEGFFKGLGKGAIGLVTRPTAGVVDFASGSFEAVKRAAEAGEEVKRLRPPRLFHEDNVLRAYCHNDARGNKLFKELEKGKYATTDTFVHAEEIVEKHEFVLASNHRVLYAIKNNIFGHWTVQWTYMWNEIATIKVTERGVDLLLKRKEDKKIMGLFPSQDALHKLILVPRKEKRERLAEIFESQRKET